MSIYLRLFLMLWALVLARGGLTVHEVMGAVRFTDLNGTARSEAAALGCTPGHRPDLWVGIGLDLSVLDHELVHALDCSDDGVLDGTYGPQPIDGEMPWYAASYCKNSRVEGPACVAQFDPQRFLDWMEGR